MLRCTDSRINSIFENNSLIGRNLAVAILFNKEYFLCLRERLQK